jgi:soluble lytic murein transglycosylase-like protein
VSTSTPSSIVVRRGDTLWGLSRRYHVDLNQLAAMNAMRLTDLLPIGRVLRLKPAPAPPPARPADPAAPVTSPAHYTAAQLDQMRSFCSDYQPPEGSGWALPSLLVAHPERLALRPLFVKWSRVYGVPTDLVQAVAWQESGWQNNVVSWAQAQGIGQLLPQTVDYVNSRLHSNLRADVAEHNIQMMSYFLAGLYHGTGNVCEAVVAYYQGTWTLNRVGTLPESQVYARSVLSLRPRFR